MKVLCTQLIVETTELTKPQNFKNILKCPFLSLRILIRF